MKISQGKKNTAVRGVIYGPEGIGKSTLASHFPDPIFLDLDNGTNRLDVKRVENDKWTWKTICETVEEIAKSGEFKTLVIDTVDMAELYCNYYTINKYNIESIAHADYGRGYQYLADEFQKFLNQLIRINRDYQINVIFLGHSKLSKFEQPEEFGAYDRYELKLEKKVAGKLKDWGDFVLFLNYKVDVVRADGKMGKTYKATGGKRVIYTTHSPVWDAKNRFGLDEELPLEYESVKPIFDTEIPQEMRVNGPDDPVFDPGIHYKTDGTVEVDEGFMIVEDEDADDPALKDVVGDPTIAKIISRLTSDGLKESDAVSLIKSRKVKPEKGDGSRLEDYKSEFLVKNVLEKWETFEKNLKTQKGK